jgi:hypothetical protein
MFRSAASVAFIKCRVMPATDDGEVALIRLR